MGPLLVRTGGEALASAFLCVWRKRPKASRELQTDSPYPFSYPYADFFMNKQQG